MPTPQIIDAGRIRPVYRGAWDADAIYEFFDVVTAASSYSGGNSSYIYLSQTAGDHTAPNSSADDNPWIVLAAGGADGDPGESGDTPDISALQYTVEGAINSGQLNGSIYVSGAIDFNDYTTPGQRVYFASTAAHLHAPPQLADSSSNYVGGWLDVEKGKNAGYCRQVVYPNYTTKFFTVSRTYNGSSWGAWRTETDSPLTFVSTTGLDLNSYVTNGGYAFGSAAVNNGSHFPSGATSGVLKVWGNNGTNFIQLYMDFNAKAWIRRGSTGSSGFTDWRLISPPYAQTAAGIGQYVSFDVEAGNACTLPAGGTWEYDVFAVTSSGSIVGHKADVKAGGTEIFAADASKAYYGHCKRVY